jgi:HlyD family secretion protein
VLDPAPFEAARAKARGGLKRAEARLRLARAKMVLAEKELERAKAKKADAADLAVAEAAVGVGKAEVAVEELSVAEAREALGLAETNLRSCKVLSPIAGVVIGRQCRVGQTVTPGLDAPSLFVIARSLKKMEVRTRLGDADIDLVEKGRVVTFEVDAYPGRKFEGKVSKVRLNEDRKGDDATYTAVIDVDNSDGKLLPYMTASVRFPLAGKKGK